MARVTNIVTNFTAGELSPKLDIRVDTQKYRNGAREIQNGIVMPHGGVRKRPGTKFVAEVKSSADEALLQAFEFNVEQTYVLEIGPNYIRQFKDQGVIAANTLTITDISKANPGVVTYTGTDPTNGQHVYVSGVGGMTQVNNRRFTVASVNAGANTFELSGIDTTSYSTYTGGGTAVVPVETTTAYAANEIEDLSFAQSADTLFIGHVSHKIAKLTRSSHTAWTLADANILNGPFRTINTDDTHYLDVSVTGSASVQGATQANPVVITTTAAHGFYEGASVAFASVGGMTNLNGNTYVARNVTSTTFELWTPEQTRVNGTAFGAYTSGGTATIALTPFGTISQGSLVTLTSTEALFTADHVGAIFRLWEPGQGSGISGPLIGNTGASMANNDQYTNDGKTYGIRNLVGDSTWGGLAVSDVPKHESGVIRVYGENYPAKYFDAVYLHDSSVVLEILSYSSSTSVTARVKRNHVPKSIIDFETNIWEEAAWSEERGYPSVIGFHEGRLFAAASDDAPQTVWASRSQSFEDFQDGPDDDDALNYTAASGRVDRFRWMMTGKSLILGSASSEYVAAASNQNEALTPSNVRMVPQTSYGSASSVKPLKIGNTTLFGQRRGMVTNAAKKIRELSYSFESDNYIAPDVTIVSEHITGTGISEMTFQADPDSVVYGIREDGVIAGLTYEAEQDVKGWHRQIIGGAFGSGNAVVEHFTTIPGDVSDEVWLIVKRTINGQTKRYIEVLSAGLLDTTDPEDAIYLDSALTYDGSSTTTITGLWHLEGQVVHALADGAKQGPFTVSNGAITLTTAASLVHVGLPYTTVIETLDLEAGARAGTAKSRMKRFSGVFLDVYRSLGGRVGASTDNMRDLIYRTPADVMGRAPALRTEQIEFDFPGGWDREAIIRIEHDEPYPFTLLGICAEQNTAG